MLFRSPEPPLLVQKASGAAGAARAKRDKSNRSLCRPLEQTQLVQKQPEQAQVVQKATRAITARSLYRKQPEQSQRVQKGSGAIATCAESPLSRRNVCRKQLVQARQVRIATGKSNRSLCRKQPEQSQRATDATSERNVNEKPRSYLKLLLLSLPKENNIIKQKTLSNLALLF